MASRKDEKERRRQERLSLEQSEREQARRRRTYSIVAGGALVAAAVVAVVVAVAAGGGGEDDHSSEPGVAKPLEIAAAEPPQQRMTDLTQAAQAAGCKLSNPEIEGRTHLSPDDERPKYKTQPPTSGPHDPVAAADGAYSTTPGDVHLVHSLEHGRIIVQHKPDISERKLARLKGLFDEDPYHMILAPQRRMPFEVAVTAWGHLAGCERLDDDAFDVIRTFTERYRDKGPEFVS